MQYGGSRGDRVDRAEDGKEELMRNNVWRRILMYLVLWVVLFLILCVVSIVKNKDVLASVISGSVSSTIAYLAVIGLMIYGIVMMLRAAIR